MFSFSLKKIFYFLSLADLFQQNVSLKLNNRFRFSITLGKIFSIGIIIFLLFNFFNSDMIRKRNPNILFQSTELATRPLITLSEKDFSLAFALQDVNSIYHEDPTIFNFEVISTKLEIESNFYNASVELIEKCPKSYFEKFDGYYEKLQLGDAYCLKNKDIRLKGYWDEDEIEYLQINIKRCENSTVSMIICKNEEEISQFFYDKYFTYWIEQKNIDLTNSENPISSRIKNIYQGIDSSQSKVSRLFVKKSLLKLDNGIFYSDEDELESYILDNIEYDVVPSSAEVFSLILYSDDKIQISQRRYQRLYDLFASLGGILNMLSIFCAVIVKIFHEIEINELILNKIYHFIDKIRSNKNFNNSSCSRKTEKKIQFERSYNHEKNKPSLCQKILLFCKFPQMAEKNDKLGSFHLSSYEKVGMYLKPLKWRNFKENLYLKYLKASSAKLDLIEVLKKLEEVDKLKSIIFNKEQRLIFNSMDKRIINLSKNDRKDDFCKYDLNLFEKSIRDRKLIEEFIEKRKKDHNLSEMDRRLVSLIE